MLSVSLRELQACDCLEEMTRLLHRAYGPLAARGMHFVASHQTVEVTRQRIAGRVCFIAESDGRIVGTVTLIPPGAGAGPNGRMLAQVG